MSKPKQWKQVRELKHADVWESRAHEADKWIGLMPCYPDDQDDSMLPAYPQEAEPDGRLWVGSGDSA